MSDILTKLQQAHANRPLTEVEVPEYPGLGPFYFYPMTVGDQRKIKRGVAKGDETQLLINWLLHAARDKDGNRIFDVPLAMEATLKAEMERFDARVMQRVNMEADGRLSTDGATECVAIMEDTAPLRALLKDHLAAQDLPLLAEAVEKVDDTILGKAFGDIRAALEAGMTAKND